MRTILLSLFILITPSVNAQSIKTTVIDPITVKDHWGVTLHTFVFGDTVTIHAYKKKGDEYKFIVESEDYADLISWRRIPFDVNEKDLKKLPNALGSDMNDFVKQKKTEVEDRLKSKTKVKALNGQFRGTVSSNYLLSSQPGALGEVKKDDNVYVIGYKNGYTYYEYAIYNDEIAGVFRTLSDGGVFTKKLDLKYMPDPYDDDIQQVLENKRKDILQRKAEEKIRFKKRVLRGEIKGILSYANLTSDDYSKCPFESGDTVTIMGYSKTNLREMYALYSDDAIGIFQTSSTPRYTFRNFEHIDFDRLPDVNDPEVMLAMDKQEAIVDSVMKIKIAESQKKLEESAKRLIAVYKENQPFFVNEISWSSNSVGGIEVSLTITNCTQQTIKYVTFQGYFKNAVGDKCRNEIGGGTIWKGKGVGPIGPCPSTIDNCSDRMYDCKGSYNFDNLTFYSRIADTFHLSSVTVQYTNGKSITLSGANLDKHVRYDD